MSQGLCTSLKVKGKMLIKTMYSDVSVASDGAGHTGRSDLNSSREAADTTLNGSLFQTLAVHGKKELGKVVLLIFSWKKLIVPVVRLSLGLRYVLASMSTRLCCILQSMLS